MYTTKKENASIPTLILDIIGRLIPIQHELNCPGVIIRAVSISLLKNIIDRGTYHFSP